MNPLFGRQVMRIIQLKASLLTHQRLGSVIASSLDQLEEALEERTYQSIVDILKTPSAN